MVLLAFLLSSTIVVTSKVYVHCDTMGGLMVKDASTALEKKEVRAAFEVAIAGRS